MRLDQTYIRIRERSIVELVDLTFLMMRAWWRPLVWLGFLGALPWIVFNLWILEPAVLYPLDYDQVPLVNVILHFCLVATESQLAMILVTAYLGRRVFEPRPSKRDVVKHVWRERGAIFVVLGLRRLVLPYLGIVVLMIFSYWLGWFPPGGMVSIGGGGDSFWSTVFSLDFLHHLILPMLVLMSREVTSPALLLRSTMLEVRGSDFLEILRAKGLPEKRIMVHATRNALLPLVTDIAVMMGFIFQGQVLLEIIFAWPGIGRELVTALGDLDYPIVQAAFYVMALTILTFNLVADLLYGVIDPRVVYD